jgi:hypothetical protein
LILDKTFCKEGDTNTGKLLGNKRRPDKLNRTSPVVLILVRSLDSQISRKYLDWFYLVNCVEEHT